MNTNNFVTIDKISSVTKNISFSHTVELTENIRSEEGAIIVGEVLEDKMKYNKLELPTGRMAVLKKGDIVAVALGKRRALKGFVGDIPENLQIDDVIHILNIGGVAGVCTSENVAEVGHAFPIKVLGAVTDGHHSLNIKDHALFPLARELHNPSSLIIVSGTCMNVGKTAVACEVTKQLSRNGYMVMATKLAGVAALKDIEKMKDYGAKEAVSFVDAGYPSTVHQNGNSVAITKGSINYLSEKNPDFIVVEFGDGILGEYGVYEILKDLEIQKATRFHIGCAHDPCGAMKLTELCNNISCPLDIISGPVTDNSVGIEFIEKNLSIPAINALSQKEHFFEFFSKICLKK